MNKGQISKYIDFVDQIQKNPSILSAIAAAKNYSEFYDFLLEIVLGNEGNFSKLISDTAFEKKKDLKVLIDSANFILNYVIFNENYNYYENIGLSKSAPRSEIVKRWKKLMLIYHPDKLNLGDNNIFECSKIINKAYSILSSEEKRGKYDRELINKTIAATRTEEVYEKKVVKVKPVKKYNIGRNHLVAESKFVDFIKRHFLFVSVAFLVLSSTVALTLIYVSNRSSAERYSSLEDQFKSDDSFHSIAEPVEPEKKKDFYEAIKNYDKFIMIHESDNIPKNVKEKQNQGTGNVSVEPDNKANTVKTEDSVQSKTVRGAPPPAVKDAKQKVIAVKKEAKAPKAIKGKAADKQYSGENKIDYLAASKNIQETDKPTTREGEEKKQTSVVAVTNAGKDSKQSVRVKNDLLIESIDNFVSKYIDYYKSRDINKFMSVYSRYARENSRRYNDIYASYKKYFENNQIVNYKITNLKVKYNPDNIIVNGKFEIEKKDRANNISTFSGIILWKLIKEDNVIKIEEANYTGATKGK